MLKQVFKDSLVYGIVDALFKALSLFTFPFMAHALTVEEYGVTALALSITGLMSIFFVGMHNSVQRFYFDPEIGEEQRPALVTTGFLSLLIGTTVFSCLIAGVAYFAKESLEQTFMLRYEYALLAIFAIVPSQIFTFAQTLLRMHFRKGAFTLISAVTNGLNVALTIYLVVVLRWGVWGFMLGYFASFVLVTPLAIYLMRRELVWRIHRELLRPMLTYAYPFIFVGLAYWLFSSMDRWMLGYLSSSDEVGLYSVAFKLTMVLSMAKTAFGQAWSPYAFKLYGEHEGYRKVYSDVLTLWYFMLVIAGSILFLFAPEFLMLTTPQQYWPAATIVSFTLAGMIMNGTCEITAIGISLQKKVHYLSRGTWLSALVNFVLNALLIPYLGGLGAALATMASYACLTLYYLWVSQEIHPIPLHKPQLAGITGLLLIALTFSCLQPIDVMSWPWAAAKVGLLLLMLLAVVPLGILRSKPPALAHS